MSESVGREIMLLLSIPEADALVVWLANSLNAGPQTRSSRAARRVLRKAQKALKLDALMQGCHPVDVRDLAQQPNSTFKAPSLKEPTNG